ncbi:MAG: thiol reductant ABC exporter subunit CydD [Geobacteraceae bacterium]|nr:thiol reductant ABC exporter subunit CydD [Geobacteraceae bacterium]
METSNLNSLEGPKVERWLLQEAVAIKRPLIISYIFTTISGVLVVLQSWFLALACHNVIIEKTSLLSILPMVWKLLLITVARSILTYFSEKHSATAAAFLKIDLRNRLYQKIVTSGFSGRNADTASLVEVMTTGVDSLETYFTRFLPSLVTAAILPLVIIFFAIPAEWRASLVLLFSAPFIPLFMILIGKGTERLNRKMWGRLSILSSAFTDLLKGLPDLRMLSSVKRAATSLSLLSEEYRTATMAVLRIAFLSAFTLEFFSTVGTAVVAVIVGFRLLSGNLSLVDGLFILLIAPEFYLPLRVLGLTYHSRMHGIAAAERIIPLLRHVDHPRSNRTFAAPPVGELLIAYDCVTYSYPGGRGGVHELSFKLIPGEITALCGQSGSGKTTTASLLIALAEPSSGSITANGADINTIDPDLWRSRIAFLPQKPFFFSGTVKDNLTIGLSDVTEDRISRSLESACAQEFVRSLPSGLDTIIGEQGAGLSGGELRRLALARLFLRNPSLVILDEPTAGLDSQNESLVCTSLRKLAQGRTVLMISHREDTVKLADRVMIMADGRLLSGGEQLNG